ncbi:MAG: efflux RND transporter permease subunit, partial [Planctomycetes bacterium]|nr:efflux RND transporter permease subunit [Planctomycetota bacterium]
VHDTHRKLRRLARINGEPGIRLGVRKQSGTNTVEVARAVVREVEQINADHPQIRIVPIIDTSEFIQRSIDNVGRTVLWGGALALLVLLFFLRNLRSTLVIATAIPISIIATFALLYLGGFTLNLMTLGGVALGVGMMVDNAIVVLENIVRVRAEEEPDRREAAVQGTGQVGAAIVASTITTLVVFLPLVFVRGQTGLLFQQLGYVVCFSLLCSLAVALTLVPMLAARLLGAGGTPGGLARIGAALFRRLEEAYLGLLAGAMRLRWLVLPAVAAVLAGSLWLAGRLGTEFMPRTDENEVRLTVEMDTGTRLEVLNEEMQGIEQIVREAVPETRSSVVSIGPSFRRRTATAEGEMRLALVPASARQRSSADIAADLRRALHSRPGMIIRTREGQGLFVLRIGTVDEGFTIDVRGHDLEVLQQLATRVRAEVAQVAGVTDARLSAEAGVPEALFRIDRDRAADLGVTVSTVARTLETAIGGTQAGEYREGGDEVRILVKVAGSERMALDELLDLTLTNTGGEQVALRNVVTVESHRGPVQIERKNQQRVVVVSANVAGRDLGAVARDVRERLQHIPLPRDSDIMLSGDVEEQQKAFRELLLSLGLALVLVYMVMACLYESLGDPLVVMVSVPFAVVGAAVVLFLTNTTINVQSFIGAILLGGIVVNNAILIVDQTSRLRGQGFDVRAALFEAARRRLRPILMTSLTTMLGLAPLALGVGEGAEAQAPMARAVVGGLASGTLVSLLVVPIVYSLFHRRSAPPPAR